MLVVLSLSNETDKIVKATHKLYIPIAELLVYNHLKYRPSLTFA